MAEMASATPARNSVVEGLVVADAEQHHRRRTRCPAMPTMILVSRSSCFCSGVLSASVWLSSVGDAADLGVHAGAGDDHLAAARG